MNVKEEIRRTHPQAKDHRRSSTNPRSWNRFLPHSLEGTSPAATLTQTSSLQNGDSKFLLFKLPRVWYVVTAAAGHSHTHQVMTMLQEAAAKPSHLCIGPGPPENSGEALPHTPPTLAPSQSGTPSPQEGVWGNNLSTLGTTHFQKSPIQHFSP